MGKLLLFLSFLSLLLLAVGTAFYPNNELFYLASTAPKIQYIREALSAVLFLQLVTHPPRSFWFRTLTGALALGVGGWSLVSTYSGTMPLLDSLSLLGAALAIGVTALEINLQSRAAKHFRDSPYHPGNPLLA
jgi:hypothetical protein